MKPLDLIKQFEGLRLDAYQDSIGIWTLGYGHIKGVKEGDCCTEEQADAWLTAEAQWSMDAVLRNVTHVMTPGQFAALVSFTYNLGEPNLKSSSLLKHFNAGDVRSAAEEFPKWCFAGGKHIEGLLNRRIAEQKVFLS